MSINDNRWSEKFDTSDLDGEDWLAPEPKVLRDIEKRIYAVPTKKAVFGSELKFVFIGLFVLVFGLGYFLFSGYSNSEVYKEDSSEAIEKSTLQAHKNYLSRDNTTELDAKSTNLASQQSEVQESSATSISQKNPSPNINVQNKFDQSHLGSAAQKKSKGPSDGNAFKQPSKFFSSNLDSNESGHINKRQGVEDIVGLQQFEKSITPHNQTVEDEVAPILRIESILVPNYSVVSSQRYFPLDMTFAQVLPYSAHQNKKGFFTEVARGQTAFALNDNFNTAVSGADFFSRDASTWSASLGYTIPFDSKLSLDLSLGYERQEFVSGHNATVDYDIASEINQSNSVALGMATPLGFLSGAAVINRDAQVDQEVTSLLVDLTNAHRIQAVNVAALLTYNVVQGESINFNVEGGLGVKRIFDVNNELLDVAVNNLAFSSQNLMITTDQDGLNKTLPAFALGARVHKQFRSIGVGLYYRYNAGLTPIYTEDGRSTTFGGSQLGLRIQF